MNTQANQMKGIVGVLTTLVNGRANGAGKEIGKDKRTSPNG